MPLESATQPHQLNATNPPSGDPAKQGYLHLQLIKQMMLLGYLGKIDDIATVRALTAPVGATFMYNFAYYQINDNFYGSTPLENTSKMINLNNGRKAYRLDNRFWFGPHQGVDVIMPANGSSYRYPVCRQIVGPSTTFPITDATASVPGGVPVVGDLVEYTTGDGSTRLTQTCYWQGSTWQKVPNEMNGTSYHHGLLGASRLQTVDLLANRARMGVFELVGLVNMEVRNPDGFGPDNLTYWFGAIADKLDGNGNILYNALTKLNALRWQALSATGGVTEGDGGEVVPDPGSPTTGGAVPASFGGLDTNYSSENETYLDKPCTASCGLLFGTNGSVTVVYDGLEIVGSPLSGKYVTTLAPNVGNLYEMQVTLTGGTISEGVTAFTPLSLSRYVRNIAYANNTGTRFQSKGGTVAITIREIATPSNTQTHTVSLGALATCNGGYTP